MMSEEVSFQVILRPKFSWADQTYLGNMLTEVLGAVAKNTEAFEFEIRSVEGEEKE